MFDLAKCNIYSMYCKVKQDSKTVVRVFQSFVEIIHVSIVSSRARFRENAYIVGKWARNLCTEIRKCVPTKRNTETQDAFQKHLSDSAVK